MEKKYMATLRIPTETYAYMEILVEGTPNEIIEIYEKFTKLYKENNEKILKQQRSENMIKNDHAKVIKEFTNN